MSKYTAAMDIKKSDYSIGYNLCGDLFKQP